MVIVIEPFQDSLIYFIQCPRVAPVAIVVKPFQGLLSFFTLLYTLQSKL